MKPKNVQFAVKADFGMPTRALTPPEFERLVFGMGKVHLSEFLPTGVSVFVSPGNPNAVAIEASQSGVRAVISDPVDSGGSGGSVVAGEEGPGVAREKRKPSPASRRRGLSGVV